MNEPGAPAQRPSRGFVEADINGERQHLVHLARGVNVAFHSDAPNTSWFQVLGQRGPQEFPSFKLHVEHAQLDRLSLPATFTTSTPGPAKLKMRYQTEPNTWWTAESGGHGEGQLVIEKYEGDRVTGTFEGVLISRVPSGDPVEVRNGNFSASLRVHATQSTKPP